MKIYVVEQKYFALDDEFPDAGREIDSAFYSLSEAQKYINDKVSNEVWACAVITEIDLRSS